MRKGTRAAYRSLSSSRLFSEVISSAASDIVDWLVSFHSAQTNLLLSDCLLEGLDKRDELAVVKLEYTNGLCQRVEVAHARLEPDVQFRRQLIVERMECRAMSATERACVTAV